MGKLAGSFELDLKIYKGLLAPENSTTLLSKSRQHIDKSIPSLIELPSLSCCLMDCKTNSFNLSKIKPVSLNCKSSTILFRALNPIILINAPGTPCPVQSTTEK